MVHAREGPCFPTSSVAQVRNEGSDENCPDPSCTLHFPKIWEILAQKARDTPGAAEQVPTHAPPNKGSHRIPCGITTKGALSIHSERVTVALIALPPPPPRQGSVDSNSFVVDGSDRPSPPNCGGQQHQSRLPGLQREDAGPPGAQAQTGH